MKLSSIAALRSGGLHRALILSRVASAVIGLSAVSGVQAAQLACGPASSPLRISTAKATWSADARYVSAPTGPAATLVDDYKWRGWFDKTTAQHQSGAGSLAGQPMQGDWISFGDGEYPNSAGGNTGSGPYPPVITDGDVANGALVARRVSFTYNEKITIAPNVDLSTIKVIGSGGFDDGTLFLVKPDTTPDSSVTNWIRTSASFAGYSAPSLINVNGANTGMGFYYGDNTIGFAVENTFHAPTTSAGNPTGLIADFEISADCLPEAPPPPTQSLICPVGNAAGDTVRIGPFTTNARDWKWTWRTNAGALENVQQPLFDDYRYRSYFNPRTLSEATTARWISPGTTDPAGTDIPGVPYPAATGQSNGGVDASTFVMNQPINVGNNVDLASIKLQGRFAFDDYGNSVYVLPAGGTASSGGTYLSNGYGTFTSLTTPAIPGFQQGENTIGFMLDGGQNTNSCSGGTCALGAIADFYVTASCTGVDPVVTPPAADLSITNSNGMTSVVPGSSVTYTITASNAGPAAVSGATVSSTLPAALTNATWTCTGLGGGTCAATGNGNINDTVSLPAGASVIYTLNATVSSTATGSLANTAAIAPPAGVDDPTPGNNSATDSDTVTAAPGAATATPVPVLDLAGLGLLGILSAGIGAMALRRRHGQGTK